MTKRADLAKVGLLAAFSLLPSIDGPISASTNEQTAITMNYEKFAYAVGIVDGLVGAKRSNNLDVSHVFRELLPRSSKIADHIAFFREVGRDPIRVRTNNINYIYFSFSESDLRRFGARHVVRGDNLVVTYETSELTDAAEILVMRTTFVNGSL